MYDVKQVLEFADALCLDARGDVNKMNRLAGSPALRFYQQNVTDRAVMTREVYAASYPQFMEEIEHYRLLAEKRAQADAELVTQSDRVAALEVKFDQMLDKLNLLLENSTPATTEDDAEPAEDPKPRKKTRKTTGNTEPAEPAAEPDAEEGAEDAPEEDED